MANSAYLKGYQRGIDTVCAQVLWALHTQEKDPWGNKRLKRLLTEINKFTHDYMDKGNNSVSIEDIVAQLKEECDITITLEKGDFDFGEDGNKKNSGNLMRISGSRYAMYMSINATIIRVVSALWLHRFVMMFHLYGEHRRTRGINL